MAKSTYNTIRNIVSGICVGLGSGYFIAVFAGTFLWFANAPGTPDLAHGLVFPHNEHGGIRYFSAAQTLAENTTFLAFPLFFLGVLIAPMKNVQKGWLYVRGDRDDPRNIGAIATYVTICAVVAVAYFAGLHILDYLVTHGLKPSADS